MADIIDQANDRAEQDLAKAIDAARSGGGLTALAKACGHCLSCGPGVPLPDGQRWCNADCRDDWQRMQTRHPRATLYR